MKLKLIAYKKKESPSNFGPAGSTWTQVSAKFEGVENPQYGYELRGFSKNQIKDLKEGQMLNGYFETRTYQKKDGTMGSSELFKAVSVDYLYDLLMKINPAVEGGAKNPTIAEQKDSWTNDYDSTAGPDDESVSPAW